MTWEMLGRQDDRGGGGGGERGDMPIYFRVASFPGSPSSCNNPKVIGGINALREGELFLGYEPIAIVVLRC